MRITMHQQGGFLGLDRKVEVEDGDLTVIEDRTRSSSLKLEGGSQARLQELAQQVMKVDPTSIDKPQWLPSDSLVTKLSVEEGDTCTLLAVASGDTAPSAVMDLIEAIDSCANRLAMPRGDPRTLG
jgi:hypothetical protein